MKGNALVPWLLFALATSLYVVTRQAALAADGIYFDEMLQSGRITNHHLLHLPIAWGVAAAFDPLFGVSYEAAMKLVSAGAGGGAVSMTFVVLRRALRSDQLAVVGALTMMVLTAVWFHATATELHALHTLCTLLLLHGLLRALDAHAEAAARLDATTLAVCAVGAFLTPLSHLSGVAAALPVLYVIWRVRSPLQRPLFLALAAGGAAFLATFGSIYLVNDNLRDAVDLATNHTSTGYAWSTTGLTLEQFALYGLPVTTLVPAGLRILFRTAPAFAWFAICWLLAWPIIALRTIDDLYGSYHLPTLPLQVALALAALRGLGRSPGRTIVILLAASAPMAFVWLEREAWGLALWGLLATALALRVRSAAEHQHWPYVLPIVAALVSAPYLGTIIGADPIRATIDMVKRRAGPDDVVIATPAVGYERSHWSRFFRKTGGGERAYCPGDLDWLMQFKPETLPGGRGPVLAGYRLAVRDRLAKQEFVWVVAGAAFPLQTEATVSADSEAFRASLRASDMSPEVQEFFVFLHQSAAFEPLAPNGIGARIYRLRPRK